MNTVAIIQARMSSSRLPGKVLADIGGRPMLYRVVSRALRCHLIDRTVVATSDAPSDDAIAAFCGLNGIPCFRGSLEDVLIRYGDAANAYGADAIVRLTGDCPLLDPHVIGKVIATFRSGDFDYASNTIERSYPDGLDTEVFTRSALERAEREARLPYDREHVTPYIIRRGDLFRLRNVAQEEDLSALRWTVDTAEDLAFVRRVYDHFGDSPFGMPELRLFLSTPVHA